MTGTPRTTTKIMLTVSAIVGIGLIASACSTHPHPHPHPPRTTGSNWGGSAPVMQERAQAPVYAPTPVQAAPPAYQGSDGRFTFTQGCTGSFTVSDARTGRAISGGRAVNSGRGLIALDGQGRQTRAVSSGISQSVTFLPDCNCRAGGNQSGEVPSTQRFAATAPSAASCTAG
jgi:hypothetical protein